MLPFKWNTDIYGSFVWTMLVLHTMHVIADGTQTLVVIAIVLFRKVHEKQLLGIKVDGLYWFFVAGAYVPVFLVVYVYPALLKGWRW
jgi:cytochrome c oxidase subunit I+III